MKKLENKIYFQTVKKDRGAYYVEYIPSDSSVRFATLQVIFPKEANLSDVANSMENELKLWLNQYPIPIMVSAFDFKGDLYNLKGVRKCDHLLGYYDNSKKRVSLFWYLLKDKDIPEDALNLDYIKKIYFDIAYKTSSDLQRENRKRIKHIQIGIALLTLWMIIIPVLLETLEWVSPPLIGVTILSYSYWKALKKALELFAFIKKSPKQIKKEKEELEMEHHHYHCKQNPEGFLRLKVENIERWEKERIQKEANSLKDIRGDVSV